MKFQTLERARVAVHGCDAVPLMQKRLSHHSSDTAGSAGYDFIVTGETFVEAYIGINPSVSEPIHE
jgi:hypothetical protein